MLEINSRALCVKHARFVRIEMFNGIYFHSYRDPRLNIDARFSNSSSSLEGNCCAAARNRSRANERVLELQSFVIVRRSYFIICVH